MAKTNVTRYLEKMHVSYTAHDYLWRDNQMVNQDRTALQPDEQQKIFKTLVLTGNKTGPLVAVIPITKELNLKKMATCSANKKVELLPLKDLEKTTGYIRGGCSPIAMKRTLPTFIDQSALNLERIIVSAGRRDVQVGLEPAKLSQLVIGTFADLLS